MSKKLTLKLEINGKTLEFGKDKEYKILSVDGLESSDFEITTLSNATYDGSTKISNRIDERVISIEGEFPNVDDVAEQKRQELIGVLNPKYDGVLTVNYGGTVRWIKASVRSFKSKRSNLYEPLSFLIILLSPDPFFRGDTFDENMAEKTKFFNAPFSVWSGGVALSYRLFNQELVLNNDGHAETGAYITFVAQRGTVTNPKIENLTTGEFVEVETEMAEGDILTVNTNQGQTRVELNGVNVSNLKNRDSRYFDLELGENVLKYSAENGYLNLDVFLKWEKKYLGV